MNIGVVYNDSDAFYKNFGHFHQNFSAFNAISGSFERDSYENNKNNFILHNIKLRSSNFRRENS